MDDRPTALIVHPGARDRLNLEHPEVGEHVRAILLEDDAPTDRPNAILERLAGDPRARAVDGVFGSSDASAHLAAHLAAQLGLPGPTPEAFMRCHDKLESRRLQRDAVPDATPRFFALDPNDPIPDPLPLPFPLFVKPVSAHLSQLAFPVHDRDQLEAAMRSARDQLDRVAAFDEELEGRSFHLMLVEELLEGRLVTFEGSMLQRDRDADRRHRFGHAPERHQLRSVRLPERRSPPTWPDRLGDIAAVLMPALGFDGSLFNIEFFVPADGTAKIVEVNGRMASQFAPLVRAVHGTSTYRLQLELVTGGRPTLPSARRDVVASSFVLRRYVEDAVVETVPDPAAVMERFPGSQVELLVRPGQRLSENDDDSASHRLAVVAMSGPDRATLLRDWEEAQRLLPFSLRAGRRAHPRPAETAYASRAP